MDMDDEDYNGLEFEEAIEGYSNYNEDGEEETDFDDFFLNDPEDFTSFISSGYGTRPDSTIPNGDASDVINSMHLNIPELEPILSLKNNNDNFKDITNSSGRGTRTKMTDLGFKMSKMIMSSTRRADNSEEDDEDDFGVKALASESQDSGDALVDNYGQRKKRQKTGKRGRPKGTVKTGTQFGRASSTHALPPNVSALMGQANLAYVQKQYDRAVELYLQVVQRAPSSPEPYYSLGLVYEEQDNFDKASSYFLIAAHLQPRAEGELWRRIAALLVQVPRKEQAIYCLTRAIKAPKPPNYRIKDDFPLFWLRAKLQLELGQYKSVLTGFGTALRGHFSQDPEDLSLFVLVARLSVRMSLAYVAAGVFKNAFRSAVSAALPLTWSHLNILIELAEVESDNFAIIELIEEFAVPCYLQSGREQGKTDWILKSPQEQLEKALASTEMPVELKLKMAIAQVHLGRMATTSSEILNYLHQLENPGIKLKLSAADALSLCNSPMSAVQILLECIEADGSLATPELCLKIGQNYRKAGDLGMAVESFLAVLQVEPEHRATRLALSETYRSLGQMEQALQVLPTESVEDSENQSVKSDEGFINWTGLDELFVKVIGIGLDLESIESENAEKDLNGEDDDSVDEYDEIYNEPGNPAGRSKVRFGPERQKRLSQFKKRLFPQISSAQSASLRSNYEKLIQSNDKKSGSFLLQFFSDNLENFRSRSTPAARGLKDEEWSGALLKILILQAGDFVSLKVGKGEWTRLLRIFKNILSVNLVRSDSVKWRIFGLILCAGFLVEDEVLFVDNFKALLNDPLNSIGSAVLSSEFLHRSRAFLAAFYHPVTFRFLMRLNRRCLEGNPAVLVLLGHQSLETQNYDEAARMYLRALSLIPGWSFAKLCVGNALLGRAFQRTCPNQLAKLMQAIGYFLDYVRDSEKGDNQLMKIQAWFNAGRACHQAGFLSQSIHFYRKCIDSPPCSSSQQYAQLAKYNLSRLYLQSGSPGMARIVLLE